MEKMLGFMLDCSRNAVMKPAEVKEFALLLKKMGYNTLMLYTEDTYELDGHEFFGHFRGRFSKDELKELDCLIIAVAHQEFKALTNDDIAKMFKNGKGIVVDVKGVRNKDEMLSLGYKYWRL